MMHFKYPLHAKFSVQVTLVNFVAMLMTNVLSQKLPQGYPKLVILLIVVVRFVSTNPHKEN